MPSGLRLLVVKEIKDLLRDPKILVGIIIFPALLLPLMGAAISVSTGSTIEKAYGNLSIYVVDDDGGPVSQALLDYFGANYVEVKEVSAPLSRSWGRSREGMSSCTSRRASPATSPGATGPRS